MKMLNFDQVVKVYKQMIEETGGEYGIRDKALLSSALMIPFQTFDLQDLFPTIEEKAARICFGIIKNHPFLDGNKRMGTHLMLLFLYFNDIKIQYSQTELSDIILDVAADKKSFEFLVEWIKEHKC